MRQNYIQHQLSADHILMQHLTSSFIILYEQIKVLTKVCVIEFDFLKISKKIKIARYIAGPWLDHGLTHGQLVGL